MKQANEIYQDMVEVFRQKTGVRPEDSSDISVRLYAAAAQVESLYHYCDWAMKQSFPQTATGEKLDLHARLRGLERGKAIPAKGEIRFYLTEPRQDAVTVPKGTVCLGGGRFVTVEEGEIPAGSLSCTVPARAEEAGTAGNVGAYTITAMAQAPAGVAGCENPKAFFHGKDAEEDDSLRARVLDSFCRLSNGANVAFYEERVRGFEDVAQVEVLPRKRGAGTVDVVVSAKNGVPSDTLLDAIGQDLDSVREISVDIEVYAPREVAVDLSVTVWPADSVDGQDAVSSVSRALEGFFDGKLLGKPIYLTHLGNLIYATGKVKNYVITAPAADLPAEQGVLPVLGNLTVTEGL